MVKKILYATDMSEKARKAYEYTLDLAERYNADITVLHVLENLSHMSNMLVGEILGHTKWEALQVEHQKRVIKQLETNLAVFCSETQAGVDSCRLTQGHIKVREGDAPGIILEEADDCGADLIVIGANGWNQSGEKRLGNTARQVVRNSGVPVFVVK